MNDLFHSFSSHHHFVFFFSLFSFVASQTCVPHIYERNRTHYDLKAFSFVSSAQFWSHYTCNFFGCQTVDKRIIKSLYRRCLYCTHERIKHTNAAVVRERKRYEQDRIDFNSVYSCWRCWTNHFQRWFIPLYRWFRRSHHKTTYHTTKSSWADVEFRFRQFDVEIRRVCALCGWHEHTSVWMLYLHTVYAERNWIRYRNQNRTTDAWENFIVVCIGATHSVPFP